MQTAEINDLRARILRNEVVTPEELEAALAVTRQQRAAAPAGKAKKAALPADFDLGGLFTKKEEEPKDET